MKANVKIVACFAGMSLLVGLGVVLSFGSFQQLEEASERRKHTYVVLSDANGLLSSLKDAETGYRGYLLTDDESFLEPYTQVRNTLLPRLNDLCQITEDPAAHRSLEAIAPLMEANLANMSYSIILRRNQQTAKSLVDISGGQSKRLMNAIRAEMGNVIQIEESKLAVRDIGLRVKMSFMFMVISATSLLTLLLAFLFAYFFYKETQRKLKHVVHLKTQKLLELEKDMNLQLQQANLTLQESQDSFRLMVESVVDYAIVMLDPDGLVVSWNSGAERIKGYSAEEIIGQHCSRFYSPEDQACGRAQLDLASTLAQGRTQAEGWRARKDGSTFWGNVVFTAIRDQDGQLRGFAQLTQDLSERRKVEVELTTARSVAEQANLAKSEFLSSMSHELRSPLNAILGFAQLMESASPLPTDAQKESIAQILRAGWHLLALINEILDLAKVESGQVPMSQEPVSLAEVLEECQGMIEPQATRRGITLLFPKGVLPYFVQADRTRVKQVLLNLLSNAVKYNAKQGTAEVACVQIPSGRIRVSVRDTGAGLAGDQLDQLFQPFNRLGQEGGSEEGTGIGLMVAKRLVELMDGSIGVDSQVGVGSVFWFTLREVAAPSVALEADLEPSAQAPTARSSQLKTVLYVEDNPDNLNLVEQILARHPDLHLLTALTGSSGLELAHQARPDVILLDINLPGMDGFEVLAYLRADGATAGIPVIAVSANAMPDDIKKGLQAGFFRYITKPIRVDDFMEALAVALALAESVRIGTSRELRLK